MSIIGIESVVYAVDDVDLATRYFTDFGLPLVEHDGSGARFVLEQGCSVVVRRGDDPALARPWYQGNGVREVIWGVDNMESLEALVAKVAVDRPVSRDVDGSAHFLAPDDIPMGLRVYKRKRVLFAPDAVNAVDNVKRLNTLRKWRHKARPKTINHVGWYTRDWLGQFDFMCERLGMKYTDHARGFALMVRGDGCNEHHSLFIANGRDNRRWYHTCFGVEDIDEIMAGANYMERRGWGRDGDMGRGLGRHRMSSALYWYHPSPVGGECEYQADADSVDDNWIPRVWNPLFGQAMWMTKMTPAFAGELDWDVRFDPDQASIAEVRAKLQQQN